MTTGDSRSATTQASGHGGGAPSSEPCGRFGQAHASTVLTEFPSWPSLGYWTTNISLIQPPPVRRGGGGNEFFVPDISTMVGFTRISQVQSPLQSTPAVLAWPVVSVLLTFTSLPSNPILVRSSARFRPYTTVIPTL